MELQTLVSDKKEYGAKLESSKPHINGVASLVQTDGKSVLCNAESGDKNGHLSLTEIYEKDKISNFVAFMHFIRGFLGAGMLTMPYTLKLVGIWTGTICLLAMGWLATFNILTLIHCSQLMCKRLKVSALDYVDVFGSAMSIGPDFSRNYSQEAKTAVAVILTIANVGYCIVYISMAAAYLQQLVPVYIGDHLFLRPYVVFFGVLLLPIGMTTTLTLLAPFSTLGNIFNMISLVTVIQYICRDLPSIDSVPWFSGIHEQRDLVLIAISNIMFSYEGIGTVLSIENRMAEKHSYGRWNGLAALGMSITVSVYTACGFFGFLKFGEKTKPSLILNLPTDEVWYQGIKVLNILGLYTAVGFTLFVPSKVIWQGIERRVTSGTLIRYGEYVVRLLIMLFMTLFAMAVPNMDLLQPLVGAMCGSSLSFVFPPLMMTFILWIPDEKVEQSTWKRVKHKILIIFYITLFLLGLSFTVFGTVEAVMRILRRYG